MAKIVREKVFRSLTLRTAKNHYLNRKLESTLTMITISIHIKPHLEEYLLAKYPSDIPGVVRLPDTTDLYHLLYELMAIRPSDKPIEQGTLRIKLPRRHSGKNPLYYNYLSPDSIKLISKKVEALFWADAHFWIDYQKHIVGQNCTEAIYQWMERYNITAISEDAIRKNYYRWRCRTRQVRRSDRP